MFLILQQAQAVIVCMVCMQADSATGMPADAAISYSTLLLHAAGSCTTG
jgi:hypothetical protein